MNWIKRLFWILARKFYPHLKYSKKFYSQFGEDMILNGFLSANYIEKGFYIDVGAHHPFKFSNTAYYYKLGWKGINIEPTPFLMKDFIKHRIRDINLCFGIAKSNGYKTFYEFSQPALNSFDSSLAKQGFTSGPKKLIRTTEIEVRTLGEILDEYLPTGQTIDFLTIDVEGLDFEVLQSNNWKKYKPKFILVEDKVDFSNLKENKIYSYLSDLGYSLEARTAKTFIFKSQEI